MITLRYHKNLGEANSWCTSLEFVGVKVRFKGGVIDIPLCTNKNPKRGHYPVIRRTDGWIVTPSVYCLDGNKWWTKGSLYEISAPYEFLSLSHGNKYTDEYMEQI